MSNINIPSGYKSSPLGIIPEDWEVKRVKDVSTIKGRIGYRGYTVEDIVNDGNGAISLSPSNIVDGKLQFNSVTSITWGKYYESPEIMLCNGDIVMVKTGSSFGKVAFVDNLPQEATINPQFVIINNIKCDNKWLCYLFDSDCIQKNVHKIVVGGAIPTMSQEEIANFKIAVPTLPEQQRIVSVLSLWDTAIAKQTALIEKLTLRKRGLMQQLLTGKKRLKGFEGEWKEVRLGEICPMERGEMLTSDNYLQGNIPVIAGGKEPAGFHSYANRQKNTITISCSGASAGFVSFHDVPIFATDCFTISESNAYNVWFIYHVLTNLQEKIYKLQTGGAQPHVHPKDVYPMKIHIPSINEQNAIASVLVNADKEIEIQKQKLAALQEQKKGLMQQLLTGKKRVI